MTLPRTLICLTVIAAVTLAANFVMSKYKADMERNAMKYADLMDRIPPEIGEWKRTKAAELPWYALEQLKVSRAENWTYVNEQTDEYVHVSFLVGPTGRLSVHTPEACMDGQGYAISQSRQRESFSAMDSSPGNDEDADNSDDRDTFWRVAITSKVLSDYQIVTYYALGTGKRWWAKNEPRYELAQYPFVLKMQVETATTSESESYNAARSFLKAFLPEIAKVYAETDLEGEYGK
ncbi:MAG: EpsI family protein [Planctomycetaceae bacterium]|nr:EpsI family protein [Planctomycetaceae bacterium]